MIGAHRTHNTAVCGHAGKDWRNHTVAGSNAEMQQFEQIGESHTSSRPKPLASTSARADSLEGR
jgi:hypothetical protein